MPMRRRREQITDYTTPPHKHDRCAKGGGIDPIAVPAAQGGAFGESLREANGERIRLAPELRRFFRGGGAAESSPPRNNQLLALGWQ